MDVLWKNRQVEINSLEIEECYFEQKPDRHRPFVLEMRERLRLCEFMETECVCTCKNVCAQTLYV